MASAGQSYMSLGAAAGGPTGRKVPAETPSNEAIDAGSGAADSTPSGTR